MFSSIEKLIGEHFEDNLPEILAAAGYGSKAALKHLNEKAIEKIEKYVQANAPLFSSILRGTRYENANPFQFLPGYFDILLNLPHNISQLIEIENSGVNKKQRQKKSNQEQASENSNTGTANIAVAVATDKPQQNDDTLKKGLVNEIIKYGEKLSVDFVLSVDNIHNLTREGDKVRCVAACSYCDKKTPCYHQGYWHCANYQTHLKSHICDAPVDEPPEITRMQPKTAIQVVEILSNQVSIENQST